MIDLSMSPVIKAVRFLLLSVVLMSLWRVVCAEETILLDPILITGGAEAIETLPGSAHLIDQVALEKFNYTDMHQVVAEVPGVYVRSEDGYGLRPNIGIRGVTSDRSQKITIMEDGVLITPAPYSAPAAYYFPNVSRMQAVEVFKGPAAIRYGPHTIGGALNMVTRSVSSTPIGELDVAYGTDHFTQYRALYTDRLNDQVSYLVEGLHYSSDGFKSLDGGGETGFERNDFNAKLRWTPRPQDTFKHYLDIKLGYADEVSNETYLGLTDADFEVSPTRRYLASQLDQFNAEHKQLHLFHHINFTDGLTLLSKLYLNRYTRSWNKLDAFTATPGSDVPSISTVLNDTSGNFRDTFYGLLTGRVNSSSLADQSLDITDNDRKFGSQGVEVIAEHPATSGDILHQWSWGARFHQDYVERDHQPKGYLVEDQHLVFNGEARDPKTLNRGETDALAVFVQDKINIEKWTLTLGTRVEYIDSAFNDKLNAAARSTHTETVVLPGAGLVYQYTDALQLLFGVYKGFSPNSPSAASEAEPEESINYEYGLRYQRDAWYLETVGFFSDYSNLIGRCRVSDVTCTAGEEFNGGEVDVLGLELVSSYTLPLGDLEMPMRLTYTYTESAFQSSSENVDFPIWGRVAVGDELPYLPNHIARLEIGLQAYQWDLSLALKYNGEMRERAGQGAIDTTPFIRAYTTLDLAGNYYWNDQLSFQWVIENLTDEIEIVSRRPFGARPNKPRSMVATVKYRF